MEADIAITIALVTGVVLIINQLSAIFRAVMIQRTVREALKKDSPLATQLLDKISEERPASGGDDRTGLVLIALALAVVGFGALNGDAAEMRRLAGIALFPLFVGVALVSRHFLRRSGERSPERG